LKVKIFEIEKRSSQDASLSNDTILFRRIFSSYDRVALTSQT
jgi:hypothetical protein